MTLLKVLFFLPLVTSQLPTQFFQSEFSIRKLVVDHVSGQVYVAGVNHLYRLSDQLKLEQEVVTGPHNDSVDCPAPPDPCVCATVSCDVPLLHPRNSIAMALLINDEKKQLIFCDNLFQGRCEKRSLTDISHLDGTARYMIVPTDERSSLIMLITPGRSGENVLYVMTTRGRLGQYRDSVPAIAIRNLTSFDLVQTNSLKPSKLDVEAQQRDTFFINYTYAYSSHGFTYFLSRQTAVENDVDIVVTRITRVCQRNEHLLDTYIEIPLECNSEGRAYRVLQTAYVTLPGSVLAKSLGISHIQPHTDIDQILIAVFSLDSVNIRSTALCVYPIAQIRRDFTKTVQRCFEGIGNTGPSYLITPTQCSATEIRIDDDYCDRYSMNFPISGNTVITATATATWTNFEPASLLVTVVRDHTVAFIGTHSGELVKMLIESGQKAHKYSSVQVASTIYPEMSFDRRHEHLYLITDKKVYRWPVADCQRYKTCDECLSSGDPFCGWCTTADRCTTEMQCHTTNMSDWFSFDTFTCPVIVSVKPHHVPVEKSTPDSVEVKVYISSMRFSSMSSFQCVYRGLGVERLTSVSSVEEEGDTTILSCQTPASNTVPTFPTGQDHIVMVLSVRVSGRPDFASTNFTFFDCSSAESCTDCSSSLFPCTWCLQSQKCVSDVSSHCSAYEVSQGYLVSSQSDSSGPSFCPRIVAINNASNILVHSGMTSSISVQVLELRKFQTDFRCHFYLSNIKDVAGRIVLSQDMRRQFIECSPVKFEYESLTGSINVPFTIESNGTMWKLDNPNNLQVRVYKCDMMADNCGACLSLELDYQCQYCVFDKKCKLRNSCTDDMVLDRDDLCQDPYISTFSPSSGPVQGGTVLSVHGKNFGRTVDDTRVFVGDVECDVFDINPFFSFKCKLRSASYTMTAPVNLIVASKYRTTSSAEFSFKMVEVSGFEPNKGPTSGGSVVTIKGNNLDIGSSAQVTFVKDTRRLICDIINRTSTSIQCRTQAADRSGVVSHILVSIDKSNTTLDQPHFNYTIDPVIMKVHPKQAIVSGGNTIKIEGDNLDSVSRPQIIIYNGDQHVYGSCIVITSTSMNCTLPNLQQLFPLDDIPTSNSYLSYGFLMDNVSSLLVMSRDNSDVLELYPDPIFHPFPDRMKKFLPGKSEYLTIDGNYIDMILTKEDYRVMIGQVECHVTSISATQLTCQPPDKLQHSRKMLNSEIVVWVRGTNTSFSVGEMLMQGEGIELTLLISIAVSFVVLVVIIIIIVCVAYHRKSRLSNKAMKRMQHQMSVLEARVAEECKEAFAELQTDITEIVGDVDGSGGIPYRDYRAFCMKVLFPNDNDHAVVRPVDEFEMSRNVLKGLKAFSQMLGNKTFLLVFIDTLEKQNEFNVNQKANVAALLSVALQNRMEYCTDVLKALLKELIEKSMDRRNHPKLLLRRTDSVAEKLLANWFTFLLYDHLTEFVGEPLFHLFRAIKQQIDKGPVDAITGEGRYSLSEEKLLRQQIKYERLTLLVRDLDGNVSQEQMVRVLDCDTISQVKEKILDTLCRNTPYSRQPKKDDLDLKWTTTQGLSPLSIILRDDSLPRKRREEGDYQQLSTLRACHVPDRAVVELVPRQHPMASLYNLSTNQEQINMSDSCVYHPPGSLLFGQTMSNHFMEQNTKRYHLVRYQENGAQKETDRGQKLVSEVYLTRLLTTKGTLQQFVDDLFQSLFTSDINHVPFAIKYIFDFLDEQATLHNIHDPQVIHTWKSNILPLRFWMNVVKNPDFIFDVCKSTIVDSCLYVIGQTLMDSCSVSDHKLGKDSPTNKLLYAKDIPRYREMVDRYYQRVQEMPSISDQDMNSVLAHQSKLHQNEFTGIAAAFELYQYANRYLEKIIEALEEDSVAVNLQLAGRLQQVALLMNCDS